MKRDNTMIIESKKLEYEKISIKSFYGRRRHVSGISFLGAKSR